MPPLATWLAAVLWACASASVQQRIHAEALMRKRTPKSTLLAADVYEKLLEASPDDDDKPLLHLKAAEAINACMRIETKGNTITIEGTVDSPEHKKIWRKYGKRALDHATIALEKRPSDARAAAAFADAFMFEGSSKGLIKQAVTGAGSKFRTNALRLQRLDDAFDAGLGYCLEGCFHHVAPWPLHDPHKARVALYKAIQVAPHSRRNHYHYAVVAYCQHDYDVALSHFRTSLRCRPTGNEVDFADFMRDQALRAEQLALSQISK